MKSSITHHSMRIAGRKTSIGLERACSECLREIAKQRNETVSGLVRLQAIAGERGEKYVSKLVSDINAERQFANLSSAIRLYVRNSRFVLSMISTS